MTLPMTRDLAPPGIRVCSAAPGLSATPLVHHLPPELQPSPDGALRLAPR